MMGILRTILFAATGLAATGAAFAQQTDSASLFRTQREHASPVAPLVRMVQYDYGRLRQDAATFRLGLRADYALRRRMSLFLAADYGGGLYGDNTAAHHARVACGIAF